MNSSNNPEIAVLQNQMTEVQRTVNRIEDSLSALMTQLDARYVPHAEFEALKADVSAFKKQYWLTHTLTALLVGVIVSVTEYVILSSLNHLK